MFLDPFGMQVEWETIEAIAETKAIDLWVLFRSWSVAVNRLLKKDGEVPQNFRNQLNKLLGTNEWYDEFYKIKSEPTLFGNQK